MAQFQWNILVVNWAQAFGTTFLPDFDIRVHFFRTEK